MPQSHSLRATSTNGQVYMTRLEMSQELSQSLAPLPVINFVPVSIYDAHKSTTDGGGQ